MFEFFKNIFAYLNAEGINYMLSGSVAMSIYIIPRATHDMDIVIELLPEDVDKFVAHFAKQYYCDKDAVIDSLKRKSMFNIIDGRSGFKADFFMVNSKRHQQAAFERRRLTEFLDMQVSIASPEDLILSKIIWIQEYQSSQQMVDINNLLEINNLDRQYISHWIKELNLATFDLSL